MNTRTALHRMAAHRFPTDDRLRRIDVEFRRQLRKAQL